MLYHCFQFLSTGAVKRVKRVNRTAYVPSLRLPMSFLARKRTLGSESIGDLVANSIFHHFD